MKKYKALTNEMKRIEVLIEDLCDEIDYWKERASKAESGEEEWRTKCFDEVEKGLKHGQIMMKNLLLATLNKK